MFSIGVQFLCLHGRIQDLRYQDLRSRYLKSEHLSQCSNFYAFMVWYWNGTVLNYQDLWSQDLRSWDLKSPKYKMVRLVPVC